MGGEVTKQDLEMLMSNQEKYTQQMVLIATRLQGISETNQKIVDKMMNGMTRDIVEGVIAGVDAREAVQAERRKDWGEKITRTDKNIERAAWFIGIVGLVIVVATVTINGIDRRNNLNDDFKRMKQELLDSHGNGGK